MRLPPCVIVLFGATGDLAHQKLIPALYAAHKRGTLHAQTRIIAIGRRDYTDAQMRAEFKATIGKVAGWDAFARRIAYHRLEFHETAAYDELLARIMILPETVRDNRMFYLATPQEAFDDITTHLARTGLAQREPSRGWHRIVYEKPFGSDLASASALNHLVHRFYDEKQVYRIDHYLGKSFVQELLAIRFTNPVFEHLWSRQYIDSVQVVVCETGGVGTRGGYYEASGAIRDMIQNHILQILSHVAMETPTRMRADEIHHEKAKVLRAIEPRHDTATVITGQYAAGNTSRGKVPAYTSEQGVPKDSKTETYAAVKLHVHNHRWEGVPFYLRTGKALMHQYAEVIITFKMGPCLLYSEKNCPPSNELVIRIQPDEGVRFRFNLADNDMQTYTGVETHWMDFCHETRDFNSPESYEMLLEDIAQGDRTLFTDWDFLKESWRITDTLRKLAPRTPDTYKAGTHGPKSGYDLLKRDGRDWAGNLEIAHHHVHRMEKGKNHKSKRGS